MADLNNELAKQQVMHILGMCDDDFEFEKRWRWEVALLDQFFHCNPNL
jgi:hypothetical protein